MIMFIKKRLRRARKNNPGALPMKLEKVINIFKKPWICDKCGFHKFHLIFNDLRSYQMKSGEGYGYFCLPCARSLGWKK